jgi:hypothetical protein
MPACAGMTNFYSISLTGSLSLNDSLRCSNYSPSNGAQRRNYVNPTHRNDHRSTRKRL